MTWMVKDFADGWINVPDEEAARKLSEEQSGAAIRLKDDSTSTCGIGKADETLTPPINDSGEGEKPAARQWRAVDEQGPRTSWRELDWRSEREVKQWEASHGVEYRDLYAAPSPKGPRDEPLEWFLKVVASGGTQGIPAGDTWSVVNAFCDDRGDDDDTYNVSEKRKLTETWHSGYGDGCATVKITGAGKAFLAALSNPAQAGDAS